MKKIIYILYLSFIVLFISCSKDSSTGPVTPECTNTVNKSIDSLYDCPPNVIACDAGKLGEAEEQKVLNWVNTIRSWHGLPLVTYKYSNDIYAQKSALINCANESLTHTPAKESKCYSDEGYKGSSTSNLWIGWNSLVNPWKSDDMIDDLLIGLNVETLCHRRWILNPFMKTVAFGRCDKINPGGMYVAASTLIVIDDSTMYSPISMNKNYIAYPEGNYPVRSFNNKWYLSFSMLANKSDMGDNRNVNYNQITLEVVNENNVQMTLSDIKTDNSPYGLPNNLQFFVNGLQEGVKYTVKITNVDNKGQKFDFNYWFKLVSTL